MKTMQRAAISVACWRCRKQKLRCTRDQPQCRRCMRANQTCSYPPPPNRKRLGVQRTAGERGGESGGERGHALNPATINRTVSDSSPSVNINHSQLRYAHNSASRPFQGAREVHTSQDTTTALHSVTYSANERRYMLDDGLDMDLADEVALFLIEIYFERHYQADLLFHKQSFIQDYLGQRLPTFISLAVFAFASLFLNHVPGGKIRGDVDITSISSVNWREVGERWAERASRAALMNADKPCLENIQACQVLAMFWLAKSETRRTNMHAAIAYRSCRILQLHRPESGGEDQHPMESEVGTRCFWACWLTKCASQLNAGFPSDCWAEVADCPLPEDSASSSMPAVKCFVDDAGSIHQQGVITSTTKLGFNSSLVMIHGLWWEVQHFVYSLQQKRHTIHDPVLRVYALDERLHDIYDRMHESIQYLSSSASALPNSTTLSRIFSLNYIYHLCLCYLHSALVPMLSGAKEQSLPKRILRLAAEQAWKHSSIMVDMAKDFLARKGVISKLWPIVGYGAYVCASIQLRCLLALDFLSTEHLKRCKILLQLTGELKSYWNNLNTVHTLMEQQFVRAERFTSVHHDQSEQDKQLPEELIDAIVTPAASSTVRLETSISTYIADEERNKSSTLDQRQYSPLAQSPDTPEPVSDTETIIQRPQCDNSTDVPCVAESWLGEQEPSTDAPVYDIESCRKQQATQDNDTWWNQAPDAFVDVFGQDFLAPELCFTMDM